MFGRLTQKFGAQESEDEESASTMHIIRFKQTTQKLMLNIIQLMMVLAYFV